MKPLSTDGADTGFGLVLPLSFFRFAICFVVSDLRVMLGLTLVASLNTESKVCELSSLPLNPGKLSVLPRVSTTLKQAILGHTIHSLFNIRTRLDEEMV